MQNTDTPFMVKNIPYEKLAEIKDAHVKDLIPLIYNQPDRRFKTFSNWVIQRFNIGNSKSSETEKRKEHDLIHFIFETISEIIGTKIVFKTCDVEKNIVWIYDESHQQEIFLDLISQGFNSIFGWLGYFMVRLYEQIIINPMFDEEGKEEDFRIDIAKRRAIVLIDEIDTYLHPKWQRKVLSVLVDKFPNTQFVVTTHSPLVVTHLDDKLNPKIYQINKDTATEILVAGRDISSALWDYFGVERRSMIYQVKIDKLFALLEKEPLPVQEIQNNLKELKGIMGEEDPDIKMAQSILESLLLMEGEEGGVSI